MNKSLTLFLLAFILFMLSCQLEPLPVPETFETVVNVPDLVLNRFMDGEELDNGDIVVVGAAKKGTQNDLFIARINLYGEVVATKTFDSGGDEEINAICKDNEGELYVVGRNTTTQKGIVFKISPKNNDFTQIWLKDDISIPNCTTVKEVAYLNGLIYAIYGTLEGAVPNCNSTGFITLNKNKEVQSCKGTYSRVGVLAASVVNGKLVYGGENGSKSTLVYADCNAPKLSYTNLEYLPYNHIRGIVATPDAVYIAGNIFYTGTLVAKTYLSKLTWSSVTQGMIFPLSSTVNANEQFDSTAHKTAYILNSMIEASKGGVVLATSFSYINEKIEYTQLKYFEFFNIGTSILVDHWKSNPFLNISSPKLINCTYLNHGGYFVIGSANQKGKVIKVNKFGRL